MVSLSCPMGSGLIDISEEEHAGCPIREGITKQPVGFGRLFPITKRVRTLSEFQIPFDNCELIGNLRCSSSS